MKVTETKSDDWKAFETMPEVVEILVGVFQQEGAQRKRVKRKKGGGETREVSTLAEIATIHELGLGVPRRSFLTGWFDENIENLSDVIFTRLAQNPPSRWGIALNQAALWTQADIQLRITRHIPPPLAESTIRNKKSSTPLLDTGQLKASILARVNGKAPR